MASKKPASKGLANLKGIHAIIQNVAEKSAVAVKKKTAEAGKKRARNLSTSTARAQSSAPATVPIGQQLRAVVELAKQERSELGWKEVFAKAKVTIEGNTALLAALQKNECLTVDPLARTVRYRTKYSLGSLAEMHDLVRRHPFGLLSTDLKDAYSQAALDLDALAADQLIFRCHSRDYPPECQIIYPNEMRLTTEVDEDMRAFLQSIELPQESTEIDAALRAAGIEKAKRSTARLNLTVITDNQPKNKKRKQTAIRHVTNVHMPELFLGEAATQID